ncbi:MULTISPECIES: Crp/Fnr family transcriptional regulator [unclassified Mesorhizobium]|uniref:Crp/Fnr family transcriptional regulator n=1 Tax=unclassified Mesorhizobium TaxID=325217 RepID=UPI00112AA0B5|nr:MULTISPECIES: Crp/Fnr family transcriptional regulator [unclassified Mesorhizobium]TPN57336.1 Crp/Fnr family transcriptional regulator [Mesorhizobium sp. B1-1-7]TPN57717.1 Crp/Fnr family transcriptional regulator [Mesorhizobium sp. B1-1-9]
MPLTGHPIVTRLTRAMKLDAADIERLAAIFEGDLSFRKREELIVHGSEFRNFCFVKDGYAIRYRLLRNGKRQILKLILPGDIIGFPVSFLDRSSYAVVAVSELVYAVCPFDSYVRLCYDQPQFGLVLSWLAAQEAATYAEHIVNLGRRTPIERLAHLLLDIHSRLQEVGLADETRFDLPFSQEVMADVLGLSVPHLNRILQQLRADRLITSNLRTVDLNDLERLKRLAQYEPMALASIPMLRHLQSP